MSEVDGMSQEGPVVLPAMLCNFSFLTVTLGLTNARALLPFLERVCAIRPFLLAD